MRADQIRELRTSLDLSRSELARFLGVSEATLVRWEADRAVTEPKGLQALLLSSLSDATKSQPLSTVARVIRSSGWDHREALRVLLDFGKSNDEDGQAGPWTKRNGHEGHR